MKKYKKCFITIICVICVYVCGFFSSFLVFNKYDVNRDGSVDILDLLKLQKYLLKQLELKDN